MKLNTTNLIGDLTGLINREFPSSKVNDYLRYRGKPVEFIEEVFGETLAPDVKRLLKSTEDNDFTVAMSGNATGKSHVAARLALYYFLVYDDACEVYLIATSEQQLKKVLWKEIMIVVGRFPELFEHATILTKSISCGPARTVTAVVIPLTGTDAQVEGKLSGSHVAGNEGEMIQCYILDEADSLPNAPAVWRAIESCLSGPGSKAVALFNPRHPVGTLQTMVREKHCNVVTLTEFDHPNVIHGPDENGVDLLPGAITRHRVIQRTHAWTRPLAPGEAPDSTCFELPAYLCGIKGVEDRAGKLLPPLTSGWRKVECSEYDYKVLARFPAQASNQLISQEWIDTARTRYDQYVAKNGTTPPMYVNAIVGADIAVMGEDSSCLCFRYGGFVAPFISWGHCEIPETEDNIVDYCEGKPVSRILVDGTGVGIGVAPHLQLRNLPAVTVMVANSPTKNCELGHFYLLNDQLAWEVREWLKGDTSMLPPDKKLLEELATYTYSVNKKRQIVVSPKDTVKALLGRSPDSFDSLKLTFYNEGIFAKMDLS